MQQRVRYLKVVPLFDQDLSKTLRAPRSAETPDSCIFSRSPWGPGEFQAFESLELAKMVLSPFSRLLFLP